MKTKSKRVTVKCMNCGAAIPATDRICKYCNTAVNRNYELSETDKKNLIYFINTIEDSFKAKEDSSWIQGISFIMLAAMGIAGYFLYSYLFKSNTKSIIFSLITGAILFIFFGFIIEVTNNRAFKKLYDEKIEDQIRSYLEEMNFNRHIFNATASENLPKKAVLKKFLY